MEKQIPATQGCSTVRKPYHTQPFQNSPVINATRWRFWHYLEQPFEPICLQQPIISTESHHRSNTLFKVQSTLNNQCLIICQLHWAYNSPICHCSTWLHLIVFQWNFSVINLSCELHKQGPNCHIVLLYRLVQNIDNGEWFYFMSASNFFVN